MAYLKQHVLSGVMTLCLMVFLATPAFSQETRAFYGELCLSDPSQNKPLLIHIPCQVSDQYGWGPMQRLTVRVFAPSGEGGKRWIQDKHQKRSWTVTLNAQKEASLSLWPALNNPSGPLTVLINGRPLSRIPFSDDKDILLEYRIEKIYEKRFADGAGVRVHFTDAILKTAGADADFPRRVLQAADEAYDILTRKLGFNAPGYGFSSADKSYAHDPDKTIDIYLGDSRSGARSADPRLKKISFKDAPCFDTVRRSETAFDAVILMPANYGQFIRQWERLNPSSLGRREVAVDLRGTLMHEMLHAVLFTYNKNLNKYSVSDAAAPGKRQADVDWYVEGLARYAETFAGARHDFFSQGFKQVLADKIRFSRGGSNYFMRYPDQAFSSLRYENALFWRFLHQRYGMQAIESLSRFLRQGDAAIPEAMERATGAPWSDLLCRYARTILFRDFNLNKDASYLKEVARTRLRIRQDGFYLKDGYGRQKQLGWTCRTDWVGKWEGEKAALDEPPVGGDVSPEADVSPWATDYVELDFARNLPRIPDIQVQCLSEKGGLAVQLAVFLENGRILADTAPYRVAAFKKPATLSLQNLVRKEGALPGSVQKIYLLLTNLDGRRSATYALSANTG